VVVSARPSIHHIHLRNCKLISLKFGQHQKLYSKFNFGSYSFTYFTWNSNWTFSSFLKNSSDSMEQILSWDANSRSASVEIPRLLWDPKFHCRVHKSPPLIPILSQMHMHAVLIILPYFPNIHSTVVFPSTPVSSEWSLPVRYSDQNFSRISYFCHACYKALILLSWISDRLLL